MEEKKINDSFDRLFKTESSTYDDFLTGRVWYARLVNYIFWHRRDHIASANLVLDMLPKDFSGKILDVPCGTGVFTRDFYLKKTNTQIVCLDYSTEMIGRFKTLLSNSSMPSEHISFQQGDVGSLPYEDESFDVVICMNGFQCFPEKDKALKEMQRVLKKGGMFAGCAYVKGVYRFADLLTKIYDKKKIMMPPHKSALQFKVHLQESFRVEKYQLIGATACFFCVKE